MAMRANDPRPPSEDILERDVTRIVRDLSSIETLWESKGPKTDADVNALVARLTMTSTPVNTRRATHPADLLREYAKGMKQTCQLQSIVLLGACDVAKEREHITPEQAKGILFLAFGDSRWAMGSKQMRILRINKIIRFIDILHLSGVHRERAYELLIRQRVSLSKFRSFTPEHFQVFEGYFRMNKTATHTPKRNLDSTRLRIPQLIHALFGGRYTLGNIEECLQPRRWTRRNMFPQLEPIHLASYNPRPHILTSFYDFFALNTDYVGRREASMINLIMLAPTLRQSGPTRYDGRDLCPELYRIVEAHENEILPMMEEMGLNIADRNCNDWEEIPPQVIRFDGYVNGLIPSTSMGVAVLLCKHPVDVILCGRRLFWEPTQMLCFRNQEVVIDSNGKQLHIFLLSVRLERRGINNAGHANAGGAGLLARGRRANGIRLPLS